MEENVLNIDDLDKKIYRIFSISRLKELMRLNELVLANPSKWDDPFENFFLRADAVGENGEGISLGNIASSWYGQCWTYTKESDALWRIYAPEKDGVRVSTTIRELLSCLWENTDPQRYLKYFIGEVDYKSRGFIEELMSRNSFWDVAMGGQNDGFAKLLCIKRPEFSHEKEVRILVHDDSEAREDGLYKCQIDYTTLFHEICLDPRFDEATYESKKVELENMGCQIPITQSELYKVSFAPIRLQ